MQSETSAGGVVIKQGKKIAWMLLLQDKNGKWTFPKGLMETNETPQITASREVTEEVCISKLKLQGSLKPVSYWYRWEGKPKHKTVHYFLFTTEGDEKLVPQHEEGIMAAKWFPLSEVEKVIGYAKTNKHLVKEAIQKFMTLA